MTRWGLVAAVALWAASGPGCDGDDPPYEFDPPSGTCVVPQPPAPLATSQVVGSGTPGSCTEAALRTAVEAGGNVTFDCGGGQVTIPVQDEITVSEDAMVDGAGRITLDGGGVTRILHTEARMALTVKGLSFVNGNASGDDPGSGGAIRLGWLSTLQVFDCAFSDNVAAADGIEGGGAIYQSSGGETTIVRSTFQRNTAISGGALDNLLSPLTVVDSTFVRNEAYGGGGAIYDDGASNYIDDDIGGVISICGCHFEGNETLGTGGAVYVWAYPPDLILINRSTFVQNAAYRPPDGSALGGAVRTGNSPLQIANSLFAENHADVHGGAYWTRGNYRTSIVNCTFYRNVAGVVGQEGGYGGALSGFNMELRNLTFVENHAEFTGGAVSAEGDLFTLDNCVFLDNTSSNEWGLSQTCTDTIPGRHNIQWPEPGSSGDPPCSADVIFADPLLGDLSPNGGPTETIPLLPGSPAMDAADGCLDTDQRGEPRQGACDMGAYEAQ